MLSRKAEDYLEAIFIIVKKKGYARPRDIVKGINVKPPSATEMLKKLSNEGLIEYEKYSEIRLTARGLSMAKKIKKRHEIFENFLKIILISDKVAEEDACILEHHLNPETVRQLSKFVDFVHSFKKSPDFFKHFRKYCNTGELPDCDKCK